MCIRDRVSNHGEEAATSVDGDERFCVVGHVMSSVLFEVEIVYQLFLKTTSNLQNSVLVIHQNNNVYFLPDFLPFFLSFLNKVDGS